MLHLDIEQNQVVLFNLRWELFEVAESEQIYLDVKRFKLKKTIQN